MGMCRSIRRNLYACAFMCVLAQTSYVEHTVAAPFRFKSLARHCSSVAQASVAMTVPHALLQPTVLRALGAYLNGIPYTWLGGDWRDYRQLCYAHRDIDRMSRVEGDARRVSQSYADSEERKRWTR